MSTRLNIMEERAIDALKYLGQTYFFAWCVALNFTISGAPKGIVEIAVAL